MNNTEFQHTLKKQLTVLPRQRVIEFALDICQRLLPEYLHFFHKRNWGDLRVLRQAVNFCEENKTEPISTNQILLQTQWKNIYLLLVTQENLLSKSLFSGLVNF